MKRKQIPLYLWVTGIVTTLCITFCVLFLMPDTRTDNPVSSLPEESYLLKDYQGKIALYQAGSNSPEKVYNIYLSTLPDLDQQNLKIGIPISDEAELEKYLENFDS